MSINVVVSSTAAGVSVSGGTSVAITVAGSTAAAITVGGGIGPAGFLINPGTATNAFGTFQLTAGDGITISTSAAQFQIASYGTAAVSSLAPVQSVAGRAGNVVLQAADVTAGTFAIARIPTISYTALANVPTSFSPSAHTHSTSDVVSFTAAAAAAAPVQSVAGRSGAVSLAAADVSGLAAVASSGSYTSLQNVPATFAPQAHTHSTADIVGYSSTPGGGYLQTINGLTGTVTIAGGAGVTVSTASSSITIAAAGSYVLPTATSGVLGGVKVGSGLTITDGVLAAAGGGGSANIVEAATAAGFPATGASSTLYVATDASRVYRWAGSVYVELGAAGGGTGEDTTLRSLFIPAAPTSVTATAGNAQATVSWTAPAALSVLPITDYTIQFQPSGGSWTTFTRAASTATSATVTGLTNGTAYTFKVSATNGLGTGSYSTASSAVTPAAGAAITYQNKFGPGSYTLTGTGTITAVVTGGGNNADTRLWLRCEAAGTLNYTLTANSEQGYDFGQLFSSPFVPSSHSSGSTSGLTSISSAVSGSGTVSGTFTVSAPGQYIVLRYSKDDGGDAGTDSITAVLSIS